MFKRFVASFVCLTFILSSFQYVHAQGFSINALPEPGKMVDVSHPYVPSLLKGMVVHPEDPFLFDFIVDNGNSGLTGNALKEETRQMVKYFLTALTVPESDIWVNLSPIEKNRIIPDSLSRTALGQNLLGQDYILKQLSSTLIYPDGALGKKFWEKVYREAKAKFNTVDIPVNTFNRVWIVPDTATVYEKGTMVYVVDAKLKVLMNQDYETRNAVLKGIRLASTDVVNEQTAAVIKEIILPAIEKEVNTGRNFAPVRQIYYSLILAKWYKDKVKDSLLSKVYVDKTKVKGVDDNDAAVVEKIYSRYLRAFKKGVYNYIKEEKDEFSGEIIPRKYFSGGFREDKITFIRDNNPQDVTGGQVGRRFMSRLKMTPPDKWRSPAMLNDALNGKRLIGDWEDAIRSVVSQMPDRQEIYIDFDRGDEGRSTIQLEIPSSSFLQSHPEDRKVIAKYLAVLINNGAHSVGASTVYIDDKTGEDLYKNVTEYFEDNFDRRDRNGNADSVTAYLSDYFGKAFEIKAGRPPFAAKEPSSTSFKVDDVKKKGVYLGIDVGGQYIKITVLKNGVNITSHLENNAQVRTLLTEAYIDSQSKTAFPDFTYEKFLRNLQLAVFKVFAYLNISIDDVNALGVSWAGAVRDNKIAASSKVLLAMQNTTIDLNDTVKVPEFRVIMGIVNANLELKKYFAIGETVHVPGDPSKTMTKEQLFKSDIQTIAEGRLKREGTISVEVRQELEDLARRILSKKGEAWDKMKTFVDDLAGKIHKGLRGYLVNDGDADLTRLYVSSILNGNVPKTDTLIIKSGTGIAGGYINKEGAIVGLSEFGRLVIDLDEKAPKNAFNKIPGLASQNISAKGVSNLARSMKIVESVVEEISADPRLATDPSVPSNIRALVGASRIDNPAERNKEIDKLLNSLEVSQIMFMRDKFPKSSKVAEDTFRIVANTMAGLIAHVAPFYGTKKALLAGGVLSGQTGPFVREEIQRILKERRIDIEVELLGEKTTSKGVPEQQFEGALGAAYFSALKSAAEQRNLNSLEVATDDMIKELAAQKTGIDAERTAASVEKLRQKINVLIQTGNEDAQALLDKLEKATRSAAMTVELKRNVGGIDLNNINVNRIGSDGNIKFDPAVITPILQNMTGLTPVFIRLTPLSGPLVILGRTTNKIASEQTPYKMGTEILLGSVPDAS